VSKYSKENIRVEDIDAFIFDFDGVITNNLVHIDQDGKELVSCNRSDGLAFDVLRKIKKPSYILSTEKNPVVTARANKLKVQALQGVGDKVKAVCRLAKEKNYEIGNIFYIGNDVNDYRVMQLCGYTACPADSHLEIKKIATITLSKKGGCGVIRELLENVFLLDFIEILYYEEATPSCLIKVK